MHTGAGAAELAVGLDIEALPAWLLRAAVQYLAVHSSMLTPIRLHSTPIHVLKEGHAVQIVLSVQGPHEQ